MTMETILLISISVILIISLAFNLRLFFNKKKLIGIIAQLLIDKEVITEKINDLNAMTSKEFSDGFIKFISDSRDAAFEYIENAQLIIKNYLGALESKDDDGATVYRMELVSLLPTNDSEPDKV